ncbi:spermidine synthase [Novosphingobium sp.]|uniref:spermidine synthase n=1 Tax=Novosphingobium sp. TaxID=1874826 RepID=UPI0025DAEA5E|nr:fused MFS/spermidine synthase [Novosphingobium sp.]
MTGSIIPQKAARPLFVLTILTGSFLLFLVQPMIARMALPRLGGAPNVWNSAMLVYQALLLGGYFYAHRLARMPVARQAKIHLILFAIAALTLPVGLIDLPPAKPGLEAIWVPALLGLSIGPVFLLVSAQAPLMQRWYAANPLAGEPWALYAASNLGSFSGLIAYPLLAEPLLSLHAQAWGWSIGYGLLFGLIALCALARRDAVDQVAVPDVQANVAPVPRRKIALWLALAAVPSGLMLSTTTHLTTDLFAMPLLWVIPLGLYLLSFVFAFSERRGAARLLTLLAWPSLFTAGALAMVSQGSSALFPVFASIALLFLICVALHGRLYDERPNAAHLTFFYLIMSVGGVVGGLFTALIAPLAFDWAWEHPILVLAAAVLIPPSDRFDWRKLPGLDQSSHHLMRLAALALALFCSWQIALIVLDNGDRAVAALWLTGVALGGLLVSQWRPLVLLVTMWAMLAEGGLLTIQETLNGMRERSYFGIYTVRERPTEKVRTLAHGTTLHGIQSTDPALIRQPLSYYGPTSGAGLAFSQAQALYGSGARLGVVGLGAGSLACYKRPGEAWTFFEIDPLVLAYSVKRTFTYLKDCAPEARVVIGDARLELARIAPASFDMLAVDAFSSDAIPLHLMTDEALGVYERALSPKGMMLIHISNRFIDLEPVLAADAKKRGLFAVKRNDVPDTSAGFSPSLWIAMSRDPQAIAGLQAGTKLQSWEKLGKPAKTVWTDDHASILSHVEWRNVLGANK